MNAFIHSFNKSSTVVPPHLGLSGEEEVGLSSELALAGRPARRGAEDTLNMKHRSQASGRGRMQ